MKRIVENIAFILTGLIIISGAGYLYINDSTWMAKCAAIVIGYFGVYLLVYEVSEFINLKWLTSILSLPIQIFLLLFVLVKPIMASMLSIILSSVLAGLVCMPLKYADLINVELCKYILLSLTSIIATTPLFNKSIQKIIDRSFNRSNNSVSSSLVHDITNVRFFMFVIYLILLIYGYIVKYSSNTNVVDEVFLSAFVTFIAYDRVIQNSSIVKKILGLIVKDLNILATKQEDMENQFRNNNHSNE